MAQQPIIRDAVADILETSGRNHASVVVGFTYRALAARVYGVDRPTAAQLSSVRRAVAALVAAGRAERSEQREPQGYSSWLTWLVDLPPETHWRGERVARNPAGVVISRTLTAEDIAAREAWEREHAPAGA